MPSSILNTDIMFPNLSGKSTEQQVFTIMNYLYMLKEQLTYSLSNLGLDNINANSFIEIAGIINQPVILRLAGVAVYRPGSPHRPAATPADAT